MNNQSAGANAYSWDFGNGETSTQENPQVTYQQDGTYIIRLVASNEDNCTDTAYYRYELFSRDYTSRMPSRLQIQAWR